MSLLRGRSAQPLDASRRTQHKTHARVLSSQCAAPHRGAFPRVVPRAQGASDASTSAQNPASMTIDGLDRDYCDDFECTSSPAVEQVRSSRRARSVCLERAGVRGLSLESFSSRERHRERALSSISLSESVRY